jgi:hypothetical protein
VSSERIDSLVIFHLSKLLQVANDQKIQLALQDTDRVLEGYFSSLGNYTHTIRSQLRAQGSALRDETALRIGMQETLLTREITLLTASAEYHTLSAYYRASPGLWALIMAIYGIIMTIIEVIRFINDILQVVTGENLAYWLDKLIPGFQEAWNNLMNKISEFSSMLGWGVDGVNHLLNGFNASADLWSMVTGKDRSAAQMEKIRSLETLGQSYSTALKKWQDNPGQQIAAHAEMWSNMRYNEGAFFISKWVDKIMVVGDKTEEALSHIGTVSSELLAIRNDMPGFIAKNIPQVVWDTLDRADAMINDRILPALQNITDKLEELDAAFEAQRKRAQELADRIAHPGDLLAEIDSLPDYIRKDQETKIGDIASRKLGSDNAAAWESERVDLRAFDKIYAALTAPIPAPEFMELEVPGRGAVAGIIEEPRETWIIGDY